MILRYKEQTCSLIRCLVSDLSILFGGLDSYKKRIDVILSGRYQHFYPYMLKSPIGKGA